MGFSKLNQDTQGGGTPVSMEQARANNQAAERKSYRESLGLPAGRLSVGTKNDTGKLRWDLVPPEFEEVVKILTFGANKYADRNWEKGISYGRLFAAAMRHLWAFARGEKLDDESGLPHLAHACCDIMFLLTYERRMMGKDWNDLTQVYLHGGSKSKIPLNKVLTYPVDHPVQGDLGSVPL